MDNQNEFSFDDDFESLLTHLPEATDDKVLAQAHFKEYLWDLVLITERRLAKAGLDDDRAYQLSCAIIAEIAHYEGGRCRYLPRGDKLQQELRNIRMFRMWHNHAWSIARVHQEICPELNQIQVYKILRIKREERRRKLQPTLF
ncbi:MAG: hypothetical protein Alis3KO_00760 [Aliiglaciecola sp.]